MEARPSKGQHTGPSVLPKRGFPKRHDLLSDGLWGALWNYQQDTIDSRLYRYTWARLETSIETMYEIKFVLRNTMIFYKSLRKPHHFLTPKIMQITRKRRFITLQKHGKQRTQRAFKMAGKAQRAWPFQSIQPLALTGEVMRSTVSTFVPICGELLWIDLFMLVNSAPW